MIRRDPVSRSGGTGGEGSVMDGSGWGGVNSGRSVAVARWRGGSNAAPS